MTVSTSPCDPPGADSSTGARGRSSLVRRLTYDRLRPPSALGRQLAAVSLLDALGSGMYYTGAALYFTRIVGLSATQVGIGLSVAGMVGLVGTVPVGMLADRIRVGWVYIGLQVLRAACYTAYCFTSTFAMFVVVAAFVGLTDSSIPPVHQAVVGRVVTGADRVDTMAKIRAVRNIGFGVGAVVGTVAIGIGTGAAFLILVGGNAASYVFVAVSLHRIGISQISAHDGSSTRRPRLAFDRRYSLAAVLNGVLAVHATLLSVGLPLWLSQHTTVPEFVIGVCVALNTVVAVVWQAPFARHAATVAGAVRCAIFAGLALAAFGLAAQAAHEVSWAWVATIAALAAALFMTFTELWQSGSGWTISYELADPTRRTAYLSTFQLGTSLQSVLAPWVITGVVLRVPFGWLWFGAVGLAAGLATRLVVPTEPAAAVAQAAGYSS